jgi:hypothetical protein
MSERQGLGEVEDGLGARLRKLLEQRVEQATIVRFADGDELSGRIAGWSRDLGNAWEHVYFDGSKSSGQEQCYFFSLSEVLSLLDPQTSRVLIEQAPAPGET